jgi:type 1 glutamine amidotransferase
MRRFFLCLFLALLTTASASHIVIMVVEDPNNYEAPRTMREFAENDLKPLGHRVTVIEGNNPLPHHFPGLAEALTNADLLVLFSRRRFPPRDQMQSIRAFLEKGKPLLGIRTANHAFAPKPGETVAPDLSPWPEFSVEVLGAPNAGYETKGLPYGASIAPGAEKSPLLEGVNAGNIQGHQSLYKVLPLSTDATPLLLGTAKTDASPTQPVAWTRTYGPSKARVFYTSLGAPEDMQIADVRILLRNAVRWTLAQ